MTKRVRKIPPSHYILVNGGMTLIELILVIAVMAVVIAAAMGAVKAMGRSSDIGKVSNDMNRIIYGINEYQMIAKTIPTGSTWPAALTDFEESDLRSRYTYKCDSTTSNFVTISTTSTFDFDPTQKLKDQNLCTNDSNTVYNADKTVTCRLVVYATQACS